MRSVLPLFFLLFSMVSSAFAASLPTRGQPAPVPTPPVRPAEFNSDSSAAASVDPKCRQDRRDPFDLGWRISPLADSEKNRCLDTSELRAMRVLRDDDRAVIIANFRHKSRNWIARWRKGDYAEVQLFIARYEQKVPLLAVAHLQTRFRLHEGVELEDPVTGQSGGIIRDVVFSWEPVFPKDVEFGMFKTLKRNYPIIPRMLSMSQAVSEYRTGKDSARQISLTPSFDMDSDVAAQLLLNHVRAGQRAGYNMVYNVLFQNCATQAFNLLDATYRHRDVQNPPKFKVGKSADPVLGPALRALRTRNLIRFDAQPIDYNRQAGLRTTR